MTRAELFHIALNQARSLVSHIGERSQSRADFRRRGTLNVCSRCSISERLSCKLASHDSSDELRGMAQQLLARAKGAQDCTESLVHLLHCLECETYADQLDQVGDCCTSPTGSPSSLLLTLSDRRFLG
jgi:hypothetical protein